MNVAKTVWGGRHAFVSFARPEQTGDAAELCQTYAIDNGAYTIHTQGGTLDVPAYADYVREWMRHPGFDWCLIPDAIGGDEQANDLLIGKWQQEGLLAVSVPVWHLHEDLARLDYLSRAFPRVALGSSGEYWRVGDERWWGRMREAMETVCDERGLPRCKLHGLRMLNPTVFSHLPLASADSTNVAQNHNRERRQHHCSPTLAALLIVERIERHAAAARYNPASCGIRENLELVG